MILKIRPEYRNLLVSGPNRGLLLYIVLAYPGPYITNGPGYANNE